MCLYLNISIFVTEDGLLIFTDIIMKFFPGCLKLFF